MTETFRLADQIRRAFEGSAWHGDSILELLADVNAKTAAARPIKDAHSIWEILLHIAAWDDVVTRRIGGTALMLKDEQNFPAVTDTSEAAWTPGDRKHKEDPPRADQGSGRLSRFATGGTGSGQDPELLQLLLHVQRHRAARALSCRPDRTAEKGGEVSILCDLCASLCVLCGQELYRKVRKDSAKVAKKTCRLNG